MCPHCQGEGGVILDGTKVAYQSLHSRLQNWWRAHEPNAPEQAQTPPNHLVFTDGFDSETVQLLRRLTQQRDRYDRKKRKFVINSDAGLNRTDYDRLKVLLAADQNNARLQAIRALVCSLPAEVRQVPVKGGSLELLFPHSSAQHLLRALVSGYPVQSLLPPSAVPCVREYVQNMDGDVADVLLRIRHNAPVVSDFVESVVKLPPQDFSNFKEFLALLLQSLCRFSEQPFSNNGTLPGLRVYCCGVRP